MKWVFSVLSESFPVVIQPCLCYLTCSSSSTSTHTQVHKHTIVFHRKGNEEREYFWSYNAFLDDKTQPCWWLLYLLQFVFLKKATPVLVKNSKDFGCLVFGLGVETHFDKKGFVIKLAEISRWKQEEMKKSRQKSGTKKLVFWSKSSKLFCSTVRIIINPK